LALRFELAQLALRWGLAEMFDALAAVADSWPGARMAAAVALPASLSGLTWNWTRATRRRRFACQSTTSGNYQISTRIDCFGPESTSHTPMSSPLLSAGRAFNFGLEF
jgi:hypothetical protein